MNNQAEKLGLIQLLLNTDTPEVLKRLKVVFQQAAKKNDTEHLLSSMATREHLMGSINQLNEGKGKAIRTSDLWK